MLFLSELGTKLIDDKREKEKVNVYEIKFQSIYRETNSKEIALSLLRRNLPIQNTETKTLAYKSMVRSNLEYCASVWSPHTEKLKSKLEQVQRRTARYVTNRYHNTSSVSAML